MPNPRPIQTEEFKKKRFQRQDETTEPLADKALSVRLPLSVDAKIRNLPKRGAWLRKVISEAAAQLEEP